MRMMLLLLLAGLVSLACAEPTPTPSAVPPATVTFTLLIPTATPTSPGSTLTRTPPATPTPTTTPTLLLSAIPDAPDRDLAELARRLAPRRNSPGGTPTPEPATERRQFWLVDFEGTGVRQVSATLRYVSQRAYWYGEDGWEVPLADLEKAVARFDAEVYLLVARIFGAPTRGGPGDPRVTILLARLAGAAGYYSSTDSYPPAVHPYTNGQPMLYIDPQVSPVGSAAFLGVIAHELQHLLHWEVDPSEDTWVNEGLSELASSMVGVSSPRLASLFLESPHSLLLWPSIPRASGPYYGGASLFASYLYTHYGGADGIRALVRRTEDGTVGVDAFLAERGYAKTFRNLFADWVVANYLSADSGPYSYPALPGRAPATHVMAGFGSVEGKVPQYAAEYIAVRLPRGGAALSFRGAKSVPLLPVAPQGGQACWWGNRGDSIDSMLTRQLDLSGVKSASLSFWLWYEIEKSWDYAYVEVSSDSGATWDILPGPRATTDNPVGNSFGPGYTGSSGGWVREVIDLTPYAGKRVSLRFEYVTDDSINADGLCVDNIAIPEIGFFDDAETDGDWVARGFLRAGSGVVQEYEVRVIETFKDGSSRVRPMEVDSQNRGRMVLSNFGAELEEATVVVAALAPKTGASAPYVLEVGPVP